MTQLLYTVAVLIRTDWMINIRQPVTLPIVKRIAAGPATITMSSVTAIAQTTPEPTTIVVGEAVDGDLQQEVTPTPVLQPHAKHEVNVRRVAMEPEGSYTTPLTWRVRPGDHLWSIASERLGVPPKPLQLWSFGASWVTRSANG